MKAREDAERVASEERLAALRRQRVESAKAVAELQVSGSVPGHQKPPWSSILFVPTL